MAKLWWLAGSMIVCGGTAVAETVEAAWDTYFYDAPRDQAHVVDEVRRQEKLDVLSCEASWCRVRFGESEGYVRAFIVHGPRNAVGPHAPGTATGCFEVEQPGGARWQRERLCRSKPLGSH